MLPWKRAPSRRPENWGDEEMLGRLLALNLRRAEARAL